MSTTLFTAVWGKQRTRIYVPDVPCPTPLASTKLKAHTAATKNMHLHILQMLTVEACKQEHAEPSEVEGKVSGDMLRQGSQSCP